LANQTGDVEHRLLPDLDLGTPPDPDAGGRHEARGCLQVLGQRERVPAADRSQNAGADRHPVASEFARPAEDPASLLDRAVDGLLVVLPPREPRSSAIDGNEHAPSRGHAEGSGAECVHEPRKCIGCKASVRVEHENDRIVRHLVQRDDGEGRSLAVRSPVAPSTGRDRCKPGSDDGCGDDPAGPIRRAIVDDRERERWSARAVDEVLPTEVGDDIGHDRRLVARRDEHVDRRRGRPRAHLTGHGRRAPKRGQRHGERTGQ